MNKPKAYSYLRFSTPEQMKGDSYRRQTELAERYALEQGLDLDQQFSFRDLGVSAFRGKNAQTGALRAFLNAVEDGDIQEGSFLLVESLDRVSRCDPWDAFPLFQQIINAGVTLVTLQDRKVYSREEMRANPLKILESLLVMARANEESATKSRRLSASWDAKRAQVASKPMTSVCPSWLRLDKVSGEFQVIEERAEIVRRIYRETLAGKGQNSIAEGLNREAAPVFGRGAQWHKTFIVKLLDSPSVIGTLVPHKLETREGRRVRVPQAPVPGYYPSVVDLELYNDVQAMRRHSKAALRGRHAKGFLSNILGGLAVCPLCGATMTRTSKGTRAKSGKPFLICTRAKAGAGCRYKAVGYQRVEEVIQEHAGYIAGTCPEGSEEVRRLERELDSTEAALEVITGHLENVLDALQRGDSQPAALVARVKELEAQQDQLKVQQRELEEQLRLVAAPALGRKLLALEEALAAAPLDRQAVNNLLRQLFKVVEVDFPSGALRFRWVHGGETSVTYAMPEEITTAPRGPGAVSTHPSTA